MLNADFMQTLAEKLLLKGRIALVVDEAWEVTDPGESVGSVGEDICGKAVLQAQLGAMDEV